MSQSAFVTLSVAHGRELVRDRMTAAANLMIPGLFLALFVAMGYLTGGSDRRTTITFMLPTAMLFILGSIAFFGTVAPAVALRQRGTLRLLSTTPLPRSTFLLALAPVRLVIAAFYIVLTAVASAAFGLLPVSRLPSLLVTCLASIALLLSLGFVLAARLSSAEATNNVLTLVLILFMFLGGGLVPLTALPRGLGTALEWGPPARMMDALGHDIVGSPADHPQWLNWIILLGVAAALAALAVRVFRWDRNANT